MTDCNQSAFMTEQPGFKVHNKVHRSLIHAEQVCEDEMKRDHLRV